MGAGRPTKYRPEFCKQLIKHMGNGYSFESFAAKIPDNGVNKDTLYEWEKVYPEFSAAKKRGQILSFAKWEKLGKLITYGKSKNANVTTWIFTMKCRFKWNDRPIIEEIDVSKIPLAELKRIVSRAQDAISEREMMIKGGGEDVESKYITKDIAKRKK